MKEIPLPNGSVALVDDEDYLKVGCDLWHVEKDLKTNYVIRRPYLEIGGQRRVRICMHTLIMGKPPTGMTIDHIDGNGLNNQKSNLRFITPRQNCQNRHQSKTSKYPGVHWDSLRQKWKSDIRIHGKHFGLGSFTSEIDAFKAYRSAVESLGESVLGAS